MKLTINTIINKDLPENEKIHSRYYSAKEKNENINYFGKWNRWNYISDDNFPTITGKYNFLHGCCDLFAKRLNELYAYHIYCIYSNNNELIHAFCTYTVDDNTFYIDVRGFTNSFEEFANEFEELNNNIDQFYVSDGFNHKIDISPREDEIFKKFINELLNDPGSDKDFTKESIIESLEQTKMHR